MLQVASQCLACFRTLNLKAGQCEACGAPPFMVLEQEDLLPLQFYKSVGGDVVEIMDRAKIGYTLIDYPSPAAEFRDVVREYRNFADATVKGETAQAGLGIQTSDMKKDGAAKIEKMRELLFKPVRDAVARAAETLAPLEAEYAMLEPHLILKPEIRGEFDRLLKCVAFNLVLAPSSREHLQSHYDFGHASLQKMAAENANGFGKLHALQRYAYFPAMSELATVLLYLQSGLGAGEFAEVIEAGEFSVNSANPNGTVRPMGDAFGLETILHLLNWRTFRKDPRRHQQARPVRATLALENFRRTLAALRSAHPVIDAYGGLTLLENGETPEAMTATAMAELAKKDSDFAFSCLLVARPLDLDSVKTAIVKSADRKIIGWIAGWADKEITLPFIEKRKFETFELRELTNAARTALETVVKSREPVLTPEVLNHVRAVALDLPRSQTEWERQSFPPELLNSLVSLLLFHETDHANLCRAVSVLSSPADAFWLRQDIRLDQALFDALAAGDDWGYRMEMFFDACARVPKEASPNFLYVEPRFLESAQTWFAMNKPDRHEDLQKLWRYLDRHASVHRNSEVLETVFRAWLVRMGLPAKLQNEDTLTYLTDLSRARLRVHPDARTFGAMLEASVVEGSAPEWRDGLKDFLRAQARERLADASALAMKRLIEQEDLFTALRKAAGEQDYVNFLMEVLLMENLDDAGLFSAFFLAVQPFVEADPSPARLSRLRARATSQQFYENKRIQNMVMDFVSRWPDPELVEAEKKAALKAAERVADTARLAGKLSMVDEMIAKLQSAYDENVRAEQKNMQERLAAASAKLSAGMMSGQPEKLAEAQTQFTNDIKLIQEEGLKKIEALANGLQQAKQMLKKIG